MNIEVSIDVEDEVRQALQDYVTVYVRSLPENFLTPCVLVEQMGAVRETTLFNHKQSGELGERSGSS